MTPDDDRLRRFLQLRTPGGGTAVEDLDLKWREIVERATSAPAAASGEQVRVVRNARRAVLVSAVAAALIATVVVSIVSQSRPHPVPIGPGPSPTTPTRGGEVPAAALANTSVTPTGWAPIQLGGLQISVPAGWQIDTTYAGGCPLRHGIAFKGVGLRHELLCPSPNPGGKQFNATSDAAAIFAATGLSRAVGQSAVNGIAVVLGDGRDGLRAEWAQGIEIEARGPLASEILGTLTHSPYSVVVGPYEASAPSSWQSVEFAGIRFSVSAAWSIQHQSSWGDCGFALAAGVVTTSTAESSGVSNCAPEDGTTGGLTPRPGVLVGSGPYAKQDIATASDDCVYAAGVRRCLLPDLQGSAWYAPSVWVAVTTSGDHTVLFEIGAYGSGLEPLEILDSIRAGSTGPPSAAFVRVCGVTQFTGGPAGGTYVPANPDQCPSPAIAGTGERVPAITITSRDARTIRVGQLLGHWSVLLQPGRYFAVGPECPATTFVVREGQPLYGVNVQIDCMAG